MAIFRWPSNEVAVWLETARNSHGIHKWEHFYDSNRTFVGHVHTNVSPWVQHFVLKINDTWLTKINGQSCEIQVRNIFDMVKRKNFCRILRFRTAALISVTTARISNLLMTSMMLVMMTIKQIKFVHIISVITAQGSRSVIHKYASNSAK